MPTEREKMVAGEAYDPLDPELVAARELARDLCWAYNATRGPDSDRRRVFFNCNCVILDVCPVRVGDYTMFGPGVQILTPMHPMSAEQRRGKEYGRAIEIGSDVWVGGGALILPGVRVGSRCVIGAGSVVTRDVPDGVFAASNPCRVIREITE